MGKIYSLYNKLSGTGNDPAVITASASGIGADGDEVVLKEFNEIGTYAELFAGLNVSDKLLLIGGDGTLNRFVNDTDGIAYPCPIYYMPNGTGNDFFRDIGGTDESTPVEITKYLARLPRVTVNGRTCRFINGVGFGIDGYCCEVGDELKAKGKPVNYTSIAIKGLLFKFKSRTATVTVENGDKTVNVYEHTWIAPTMFGRYYGGGMIAAPAQDRLSENMTVSAVIMHRRSRLGTLMVFPSIFKGEHVKHTDMVAVLTGKTVTVRFDSPSPLQIDGETVKDVLEYTVTCD